MELKQAAPGGVIPSGQRKKTPVVPEPLVEYLRGLFPQRCPSPGDKPSEIFYRSGQASVVAYLDQLLEKQNEI